MKDTTRYVRSHHGPATVIYDWDMPEYVLNARYPGGTRGIAMLTRNHGWRRKASGVRLWVYGRIDADETDVRFIDGPQPVYEPPQKTDEPSLEADLANDPAFVAALRDDRFAMAVCKAFDGGLYGNLLQTGLERPWYHRSGQSGPWRMVMVSDFKNVITGLRNRGELRDDYLACLEFPGELPSLHDDLKARLHEQLAIDTELLSRLRPSDRKRSEKARLPIAPLETRVRDMHQNADVFAKLDAMLVQYGWRPEFEADRLKSVRSELAPGVALLREFKRLEARPQSPLAPWARKIDERNDIRERQRGGATAWRVGNNLYIMSKLTDEEREVERTDFLSKLLGLVRSGRISKDEYRALHPRVERASKNIVIHRYWLPEDPDAW